nr:MAG TPA: Protein of unknown function (DUF551) [Caudoviricetes sp.]
MKLVDIEPIVAGWKDAAKDAKSRSEIYEKTETSDGLVITAVIDEAANLVMGMAEDLEKAPSITTKDIVKRLWNNVKDVLPPESEDVLVACADGDRLIAFWQSSCGEERKRDWMESRECIPLNDVTHWMWIPEPPKGEQK